jgi:hypothetical protein
MIGEIISGLHIRQFLQKEFPASVTASVAPPSIGANEQIFAVYIIIFSN